MGSSSSVMRPQELVEFRKLNTSIENIDIPARADSRVLTDKKGFLIYGIAILILLPFLIYSLTKSDFRHFTSNSDNCGDFCGYSNSKIADISCSGKNLLDKPFLQDGECVEFCKFDRTIKGGRCVNELERHRGRFRRALDSIFENAKGGDDQFVTKGLQRGRLEGWKFAITIPITVAVCILILVMLRFMPGPFVWSILIFSLLVLIGSAGFLWYEYIAVSQTATDNSMPFLLVALFWSFVALIIVIVTLCLFKKIGLVIQLYKETVKVLAAMPLLVFIPVLVTLFQIIVYVACVVTTVFLFAARDIVQIDDRYEYQLSGVIVFTIVYNIIVAVWTMRFIGGIQFMIISGSVVRWFFARNKQYLGSPICSSTCVTFRYHIGTLAFGSFILTLFSVVKAIIKSCCRNACCRCFIIMCCSNVEILLKFLSENSYIETAIHGQSYLRSAKRATKLLLTNAASVVAINCVGDFVLGMIMFVVTVVSTGISYALFMNLAADAAVPVLLCFWINLVIVCIMFGTFQTIIDTLFICFCEDSVINDGVSKPYYMSRGLMEFVENSKKIYGQQNGR